MTEYSSNLACLLGYAQRCPMFRVRFARVSCPWLRFVKFHFMRCPLRRFCGKSDVGRGTWRVRPSSTQRPGPMADEDVEVPMSGPQLRFRSYQPQSSALQGLAIEKTRVPQPEAPSEVVAHSDPAQEPLLNLAPKRPNWDLKRDLETQSKRLRAMTDRAIVRLIAARVAEEQEEEREATEGSSKDENVVDLANAVARRQELDGDDE